MTLRRRRVPTIDRTVDEHPHYRRPMQMQLPADLQMEMTPPMPLSPDLPPPPAIVAPIEISRPDAAGRLTVAYAPGPFVLYAPAVRDVALPTGKRSFTWVVPVPSGCIIAVRTFLGWDAGSIGEATIELVIGDFRLYERSEHKEVAGNYDAWRSAPVRYWPRRPGKSTNVTFVVSAEMLAPRTVDGGLSTRVEGAFRLTIDRSCDD